MQTFKLIAPALFKHKVVPFLWGSQGIGKTQALEQIASQMGVNFVHLHMANLEVGDLVGLLMKRENGTVYHARPEWFPTEGQGIIFLDELNRMHPDVMQAMFSFITSGTIHTHKLPPGWSIAAAGNYQSGDFQVTDTSDSAWMSRFCHIDFKPTVEEFTLHAEKAGADQLAAFITEHPLMLEANANKSFDFASITPDRRAWLKYVYPLDSDASVPEEHRYELYQGLVGPAAAAAYQTFKKKPEKAISISQILTAYPKYKAKVVECSNGAATRFDYLNRPINELLTKLADDSNLISNDKKLENLKNFLLDIPLELSQCVFKDISKLTFARKNDLLNDMTFCRQIAGKVSPV
jgi:hypothetical protein